MSGRKDDAGKRQLSLIPRAAREAAAEAFEVGARKYGRDNYKAGLLASRLVDACERHLQAWWDGEERDPKDGQLHLGSVIACAGMLLELQRLGRLEDDRFIPAAAPEAVEVPAGFSTFNYRGGPQIGNETFRSDGKVVDAGGQVVGTWTAGGADSYGGPEPGTAVGQVDSGLPGPRAGVPKQ